MPTRKQIKKAKKRRRAFEAVLSRVWSITAARISSEGCVECGGKWLDCSPSIVQHLPNCPGTERQKEVGLAMLAYKRDIL